MKKYLIITAAAISLAWLLWRLLDATIEAEDEWRRGGIGSYDPYGLT